MPFIFSNRATAQLANALDPDDTNMTVQTGQGVPFPVPGGGNVAQLTIVAVDGTHEIVTCTSRVGDNFVIARGQESTPAGSFAAGSRVELRLTAAAFNSFLAKSGGVMEGDIDLNGHTLLNANLTGLVASEYTATKGVLGYDRNFNHQIQFTGGGAWPKIDGSKILTWAFLGQAIFIYYGGIEFLPSYLKICDGRNGTPDLRDRFVICSGPGHPQFTGGGDFNVYLTEAGTHSHGGGVGGTQLAWNMVPPIAPLSKTFGSIQFTSGNFQVLRDVSNPVHTGVGGHHGHEIWPDGLHNHSGSYHPPYMSLYYVMLNESAFN